MSQRTADGSFRCCGTLAPWRLPSRWQAEQHPAPATLNCSVVRWSKAGLHQARPKPKPNPPRRHGGHPAPVRSARGIKSGTTRKTNPSRATRDLSTRSNAVRLQSHADQTTASRSTPRAVSIFSCAASSKRDQSSLKVLVDCIEPK